jgi:predicted nuclease of restriction endonuclease-like (RecB) superfamily
MQGFSPRNLKYMRALAQAWPTPAIVQQAVAQLPWSHIVTLLDKLEEPDARNWYAAQSLEHGWSRNVLAMQIDTHAYSRAVPRSRILMCDCHRRNPIWRAKR